MAAIWKPLFSFVTMVGSLGGLYLIGDLAPGEACVGADRLLKQNQLEQAEKTYLALVGSPTVRTNDIDCAVTGLEDAQQALCDRAHALQDNGRRDAAMVLADRLNSGGHLCQIDISTTSTTPPTTTTQRQSSRALSARIELELEEPSEWAMECQGPDARASAVIEEPNGTSNEIAAKLIAPEPDGHTIGCPPVTFSVELEDITESPAGGVVESVTTTPHTAAAPSILSAVAVAAETDQTNTSTSRAEGDTNGDTGSDGGGNGEGEANFDRESLLPPAQTLRARIERGASQVLSPILRTSIGPTTFWPVWLFLVGLATVLFARWYNRTRDPGVIGGVTIEDGTGDDGTGISARTAFRQTAFGLSMGRAPIEGGGMSGVQGLLEKDPIAGPALAVIGLATDRASYAINGTASKSGLTLEIDGPDYSSIRSHAGEKLHHLEAIEVAAAKGAAALVHESRGRIGRRNGKSEAQLAAEAIALLLVERA